MKTTEEIVNEIMSDPKKQKQTAESIDRVKTDSLYVSENYKTFLKQFPEEWIAVYKKQVIAHDKDVYSLFSILDKTCKEDPVIYKITEKKPRIILSTFD